MATLTGLKLYTAMAVYTIDPAWPQPSSLLTVFSILNHNYKTTSAPPGHNSTVSKTIICLGLSSDMTGSILGVYYATIVIASPVLAVYMTKIGQANMLQVSGINYKLL